MQSRTLFCPGLLFLSTLLISTRATSLNFTFVNSIINSHLDSSTQLRFAQDDTRSENPIAALQNDSDLIEFQVAQLFLDFLFEFVAFGEHGGEFFGVGFHLGVEFVGGDIDVVYLDAEILAGAQAVAFFLDFAVGHDYAEVFDGFGLAEGGHDFLDFGIFEADFLEAVRVLVFLAEFACVNEGDFVVVGLFAGLVEEENAHVGAGACAGVVAFYVVQVGVVAHQEAGHDFRDGLGGVILGVLAAAESEESPRNISKTCLSISFITTFITTFSDFITTSLVIDRLKSYFSRDFCNAIIYSALLTARIFEGTRPNSICKKFMTKRDILPLPSTHG